jgi:putative transcriptional regulator
MTDPIRTDTGLTGKLLVASPLLRAPEFERTVVKLLDHGTEGALGVILNRPGDAPLVEIVPPVADIASSPAVLFAGGPVEPRAAIALGVTVGGAVGEGWKPLTPPLVTVDLDSDPDVLASSLRELRVFAGYAGWAGGQLEDEIAQGAWYVVDDLPSDTFNDVPDRLWSDVLRRQPWPLSAVATCPLDPTMN